MPSERAAETAGERILLYVNTLPRTSLDVAVCVCTIQSLNTTTISESNAHTMTA